MVGAAAMSIEVRWSRSASRWLLLLVSAALASGAGVQGSTSDRADAPEGLPVDLVADLALAPGRHLAEFFSLPRSATMEGVAYFFVDDGIHGNELWRSDGTALGTYLLHDACPGLCGADLIYAWGAIAVAGGRVYFAADDGVHGLELWATDGTVLGTHLVRDIRPGLEPSRPEYFLPLGNLLVFSADDGAHGTELWRSDGTPGGTYLLAELTPGLSGQPIRHLYEGTGFLYAAGGFGTNPGLWRVDGTSMGTIELLSDAQLPGSSFHKWSSFVALPDGRLVFAASSPETGEEPWISDGTASGTQLLADLVPGTEGSYPEGFTLFGTSVLFHASATSRPGDFEGLWSIDTSDLSVAEIPLPTGLSPSYGASFAAHADTFYFAGQDASSGRELWKLDALGANRVIDLWPGPDSGHPFSSGRAYFDMPLQPFGDQLVFAGFDPEQDLELWSTAGGEEGTVRLTELAPGPSPTYLLGNAANSGWATTGTRILFQDWTEEEGYRLHRTDGTLAGTATVRALDGQTTSLHPAEPPGYFSAYVGPDCRALAGGHLTFAADVAPYGEDRRLFSVDATSLAVEELPSLGPFNRSFGCASVAGRGLYFSTDGELGTLHATDGTAAGTEALFSKPVSSANSWSSSHRSPFVRHGGGWVGFTSEDWIITDGTPPGTTVESTPVGDAAWFVSLSEVLLVGEQELWRSDGDAASASPIREAGTDEPWGGPEDFARLGDRLLFTAEHGGLGRELWSTDGTPGGTLLLADVRPGPSGSSSRHYSDLIDGDPEPHVVALDERALFSGDDGVHGLELWVTDGTPGGTALLADLYLGSYPSSPRELRRVGDEVFFVAEHPLYGRELFATDGTPEGTHLVRDLVPGAESSVPQALTAYKNLLLFSAWTPQFGREAWRSDGTPEGTVRITDLAPGPGSSSPDRFAVVGDRLFFAANDHLHGFELFTLVDPALADIFRDGFESGGLARWSAAP